MINNKRLSRMWISLTIVLFGSMIQCSPQIDVTPQDLQEVDQIIDAYEQLGSFSGAVLIAKEGKSRYQRAVGFSDIAAGIPNSMETTFHIGSIIKIFTQVLVLQQSENGRIDLNDRLGKHLSGFPSAVAGKVRIRHLLNHTAGFGDIFVPAYMQHVRDFQTIGDKLALLKDEPLLSEPGTAEKYSNYGYIVLGAILEEVTGESYQQLLQQHIFDPLDMQNTYFELAEKLEDAARSYRFVPNGEVVDHTSLLEYPTPDGGIYATCADLLTFVQAFLYSDELLSPSSKTQLISNYRETDVSHWQRFLNSSDSFVHEAGGGPGVSASIAQMVKENITVIVLANYDQAIAESIALRTMDILRGRDYPPVRLPRTHIIYRQAQEKGWNYVLANRESILEEGGYRNGLIRYSDLNTLGYELLWANDLDRAKEVFNANLRLFPDMPEVYDSLAEAYWWSGDLQKAKELYQKALSIDPEYAYSKMMLEKINEQFNDQ